MRNLGILWVLYGLLRLVGALGVFLYSGTLTLMWGALLTRVPDPYTLMGLFHSFLIFAIILGIVAGVVSVIAGLNLMSGRIGAKSGARRGVLWVGQRAIRNRVRRLYIGRIGSCRRTEFLGDRRDSAIF